MNQYQRTARTLALALALAGIEAYRDAREATASAPTAEAAAIGAAQALTEPAFREAAAGALKTGDRSDASGRPVAEGSVAKRPEADALRGLAAEETVQLVLVDATQVARDADGKPVLSQEQIRAAIAANPSLTVKRDRLQVDAEGRVTLDGSASDAVRRALDANHSEPTSALAVIGILAIVLLVLIAAYAVIVALVK